MSNYDHLLDKAFDLLSAPKEERIEYVNTDKWIGYPRAKEVMERLSDLMVYPKTERMPSILIIGDSNNGKSKLLNKWASMYPTNVDEETGDLYFPIVMISAPSKPDEKAFFMRILRELMVPYSKTDSVEILREKAIRMMLGRQTKVLIIDEIQHSIAGSYQSQKVFLNSIKDLSNSLRIPIIGAGIEDAFHAIQVDPQLANRFQIEILERWRFNSRDQRRTFAQLLLSIESMLPLPEPSFLYKKPLIDKMYYLSEGLIGEAINATKALSIYAIRNDLPAITEDIFDNVKLIPPSKRKEALQRLR